MKDTKVNPIPGIFRKEVISAFYRLDTPFYYYDLDVLKITLTLAQKEAEKHGFLLHYALKANSNSRILEEIIKLGYGAECVSGNEVLHASRNGFANESIILSGVGKSDREIIQSLELGIGCFNCESIQELEVINDIAGRCGKKAPFALRINPNVHAYTHKYITTGLEENKFGINPWDFDQVLEKLSELENLEWVGLHFHIGSQVSDLTVFKNLCSRVNEINRWFVSRKFFPKVLNLGGGLGVDYEHPDNRMVPDFQSYFGVFSEFLELFPGQEVHLEPGRSLVAQCGSLVTRVLFIKQGVNVTFAICDAGMTELLRPALYQAYHHIQNLTAVGNETLPYDIVGPICESSDCFGKMIALPPTQRGDLLAIRSTGAYGQTMASGYNMRDLVKDVYSDELQ
jgi:diaminopimelate decarboxylase